MSKIKDISGQRFGRLTAVRFSHIDDGRLAWWNCSCACGEVTVSRGNDLRSGRAQSCGCLQRENAADAKRTHGLHDAPEYRVWKLMRRRCNNPRDKEYQNYGSRGISVCERWENSFENFIADMGRRPSDRHSIERVDNDKGYEPSNCIWATDYEQTRNMRRNRVVQFRGKEMCVTDASLEAGIDRHAVYLLVWKLGCSHQAAFDHVAGTKAGALG